MERKQVECILSHSISFHHFLYIRFGLDDKIALLYYEILIQ